MSDYQPVYEVESGDIVSTTQLLAVQADDSVNLVPAISVSVNCVAVLHGSDTTIERPDVEFVIWVGSVVPDNKSATDMEVLTA